jgi:hypothetical protein
MRLRRAIPAGILDAGFASLGTFLVGVFATITLEPALLGVYALFFTAFLLSAVVPTNLIMLPAEVAALALPPRERVTIALPTLRLSVPICVGGSSLACVVAALIASAVSMQVIVALAICAMVSGVLSPLQDHLRRLLHLSGLSWRAATTSIVQSIAVAVGITSLWVIGVPTYWIPFTSLAMANAVSLVVAYALLDHRRARVRLPLTYGSLIPSGRLLLVVGGAPVLAGFIVAALVSWLATPEALGFAEAARILSQPVLVLGLGLGAVIGPRSMESGANLDRDAASRYARIYGVALALLTAVWALAVGIPWPGSPVTVYFASAYALPGLVLLTLLGNLLNGAAAPHRSELLGAHKESNLARIETTGSLGQCLLAFLSGVFHAYTRPTAALVHGIIRLVGFHRVRRKMYNLLDVNSPPGAGPNR